MLSVYVQVCNMMLYEVNVVLDFFCRLIGMNPQSRCTMEMQSPLKQLGQDPPDEKFNHLGKKISSLGLQLGHF